jgi:Na+/H+-translocating membrane pyrophosphatase
MVRDFVTVPITQCDFPDFHVPSEHLVEVAALAMCLGAWVYRRGQAEWPQLLDNVTHVVVEVTKDDDRSIGVLSDNVSDNLSDSDRPVPEVLLFSRFEITIKNLDILAAQLQLCPAEECAESLH